MFVVKEIDSSMHSHELRICSSLIDAIYSMAEHQNECLRESSNKGGMVTATEDENNLACGVLTGDKLTTFAVYYRSGDAKSDKPVPNLNDVAKRLAK